LPGPLAWPTGLAGLAGWLAGPWPALAGWLGWLAGLPWLAGWPTGLAGLAWLAGWPTGLAGLAWPPTLPHTPSINLTFSSEVNANSSHWLCTHV